MSDSPHKSHLDRPVQQDKRCCKLRNDRGYWKGLRRKNRSWYPQQNTPNDMSLQNKHWRLDKHFRMFRSFGDLFGFACTHHHKDLASLVGKRTSRYYSIDCPCRQCRNHRSFGDRSGYRRTTNHKPSATQNKKKNKLPLNKNSRWDKPFHSYRSAEATCSDQHSSLHSSFALWSIDMHPQNRTVPPYRSCRKHRSCCCLCAYPHTHHHTRLGL